MKCAGNHVDTGYDPGTGKGMFKGAQVLILNKADYLKTERFNLKYFKKGVRLLNPNVKFFTVSAKTGEGIDDWISWLDDQVINYRFQT